jgi:hypothetical protein
MCCALAARDGKGALFKLNWKRSFGLAMLRFWKRSLPRGFFRYKDKAEGVSGRVAITHVYAKGSSGLFVSSRLVFRLGLKRRFSPFLLELARRIL